MRGWPTAAPRVSAEQRDRFSVRSCNTTSPKQTEGKKREGRAFEKPSHEQMVTSVRCVEVLVGTQRHDAGGVNVIVGDVIVSLNVIKVHRR